MIKKIKRVIRTKVADFLWFVSRVLLRLSGKVVKLSHIVRWLA